MYMSRRDAHEDPNTYDEEDIEIAAANILHHLGLSWEQLRGKTVLDIGAGDAALERAAHKRGIRLIALDFVAGGTGIVAKDLQYLKEIAYVQADACRLPFADETIDLAIAHAGPPHCMVQDQMQLRTLLHEVNRVIKKDGEFRFGSANPDGGLPSRLYSEMQRRELVDERHIQKETLRLLRSILPDISRYTIPEDEESQLSHGHYYLLKKH